MDALVTLQIALASLASICLGLWPQKNVRESEANQSPNAHETSSRIPTERPMINAAIAAIAVNANMKMECFICSK